MTTPTVLHIRDHNFDVSPHDLYVSRGVPREVVVHLDREGGTVDCWRINGDKAESLGVAAVGQCGCP